MSARLLQLVPPALAPAWTRAELSGRLTELSGRGATSSLTAAASLVLDAQLAGEPCAWITRSESTFFPPDLASMGIDIDALAVVFVTSPAEAARAAARLIRSGGFGAVILDLGAAAEVSIPLQGRLTGLAIKHDTAVVLITEKPASAPSVGSMISLRIEAQRKRIEEARFSIHFEILKDKRRGPGWAHEEVARGPAGLR